LHSDSASRFWHSSLKSVTVIESTENAQVAQEAEFLHGDESRSRFSGSDGNSRRSTGSMSFVVGGASTAPTDDKEHGGDSIVAPSSYHESSRASSRRSIWSEDNHDDADLVSDVERDDGSHSRFDQDSYVTDSYSSGGSRVQVRRSVREVARKVCWMLLGTCPRE
jgi:hypothetical protein